MKSEGAEILTKEVDDILLKKCKLKYSIGELKKIADWVPEDSCIVDNFLRFVKDNSKKIKEILESE